MRAPVGLAEIIAFYGDPLAFVGKDGAVTTFWEVNMVLVPMPGPLSLGWNLSQAATRVRVHEKIADVVQDTFDELAKGPWMHLRTYDGGYTWRTQRGDSGKLSMHAYGAALDFDAATNPLGLRGDMHQDVVAVFDAHGWTWGGRFKTRLDPQHFQFGSGY